VPGLAPSVLGSRPMLTYILGAFQKLMLFLALSGSLNAEFDRLQPGRDHTKLAAQIAQVALSEPVLLRKGWDSPKGASALLGATVGQESSYGARRVGDSRHSFGITQIFGRKDLENDDDGALREGWRQIRVSFEMCPDEPFGAYLSGKCLDGTVKRESAARMRLAKTIKENL
jgi:hypothetical protein